MKFAVLCPGQGSQHAGMFDCVAGVPKAEAVIEAAGSVLPTPVRELLATGADIYRNRLAQPLLCAAILSRWQALKDDLPEPDLVLGYSVGEVAAHAVAGTYAVEDCLRLAARRAQLMDDATPPGGGLVAVLGLREREIRDVCAVAGVEIAIANGTAHFVLGGPSQSVAAATELAEARGAKVVRINVEAPAHTPWLRAAAEGFHAELARTTLCQARMRILAGIDGHVVRDPRDAATSLSAQIAQTVDWHRCVTHGIEMGIEVFLELGPGDSLCRMIRESHPSVVARSLDEFRTLSGAVGGIRRALEQA